MTKVHPQLLLGLHDVTSLNSAKMMRDDEIQGLSQCKDPSTEYRRLRAVCFTDRVYEQLCLERDEQTTVIQELRSELAETKASSTVLAQQMASSPRWQVHLAAL